MSPFGSGIYHRVIAEISWSWGVEEPGTVAGGFTPRKALHQ
jgi:hypothetical protein